MNCKFAICVLALFFFSPLQQKDRFHAGEVITEFGKVASVVPDMKLDEQTKLRICFDVADKSKRDSINRSFDSAARFINLNVEAGAIAENIEVAIVVHGTAAIDVTGPKFYAKANEGRENHNAKVIAELQRNGTSIYLCGQTAAGRGIGKSDLLPGVKIAPSAMTAHTLLQHAGFALSPF